MDKQTRKMMNRGIFTALLALLLSACSITPGMRMDTRDLPESGVDTEAARQQFQNQIRFEPVTAALIARQLSTGVTQPRQPELTSSDADYQYRISPQDVLQITVWDHPELTTPAGEFRASSEQGLLVRKDGTIFYPYVGVVEVAGMTVEEIRRMISKKLKSVIEKPQVDVRVAAFRGREVYVTGEVTKPGSVPLTDAPLHILDALYKAGGVQPSPGGNAQQFGLQKEADLQHVTLTRNGKTYPVDVLAILRGGQIDRNYLLRDGDILHVPDNMWNKVFVMGEVKAPSSLLIHEGSMTLAEALGDTKGVDMTSADPGRIYVIRGGRVTADDGKQGWRFRPDDKPQVFALDARSPDALILADQFRLQPRDIVFVSTAPIVEWGRVLGQLRETIQAVAITRALTR